VPVRGHEPIQTLERPRRRVIGRRFLLRVIITTRRITCSFQI
jgi:hypothetical protein